MSAYLRLNRFADVANYAFFSSAQHQSLVADPNSLDVSLIESSRNPSQENIENNQRTWQIFRNSLLETIGKKKFEWICHRYRSRLNFTRMEQSGKPLLPEHIELFSIGSHQLLSQDVKSRFPGNLKSLTREQLRERIQWVQPFPIVGAYQDPLKITGDPRSSLACIFHNRVLMDKEKQLIFSDAARLSYHSWVERFAKVAINRELLEGQLIPVSGQDGKLDYYKVYRKITTGNGLIAYALKPTTCDSTLKPVIFFRPSQWAFSNEDAFETYLNDVQKNLGERGWLPARPLFEQLMQDSHFRENGEQVMIAGYSLGGAHAQRFLEDHYQNVSHALFYSDPGIDQDTAERITDKINAMPRRNEPLNIQIFRVKGDFCHYFGEKHVGCGITHPDVNIQLMNIDHENKKISAMFLHAHRIFDNTTFPYQMVCYEDREELLKQLDHSQRGPEALWHEKMRRIWGGSVFYLLYGFSTLIKMVSSIFGIKTLRSSLDPDF